MGFRDFLKEGGYPLPVNSGVLEALIFDADTSREKMTQNHQKTRRVLGKKKWFERKRLFVRHVA